MSTDGAPSPKFMFSNSISEFVQFCPACFDEVQRLTSSLPSKQCGLDPIPTWLLKRFSCLLLPYLVHLFNKSLSSGQFPRSFREAQVRPILKKSTLDPQLTSSTDQFPISACFQSFWSAFFSAVSSSTSTKMHYFPRHSQHVFRTTPQKLLS